MKKKLEDELEPLALFLYSIKSEETKSKYTNKLEIFLDFIGLNGTLEEKTKQFAEKGKSGTNWALTSIMKFMSYQKERADRKEIVSGTVLNYYKPVKLFCELNEINLNWKKITRGLPRGRKYSADRAPTVEELRMLVEYPDRRIKPIVYVMCSGGIRLGAWDYLSWKNVEPTIENGELIAAKLTVYEGTDEQYISFITPEAYNSLKQWMEFREKSGEKITGESWVMRNLWNVEENGKGLAKFPRKLKSTGIKSLVERALFAQGIRKPLADGKKRHEFKALHSFRKFFKSKAETAMSSLVCETLLGHNTGLAMSYYKPTEAELLREYRKAIPVLQVSEVAQAKRELQVSEKNWQAQFEVMKTTVATIQSQLSFLTSAVVAAKTSAVQA